METSEQINEIAAALAKAQAEIQNASKDAKNPAFKRDGKELRYATLTSVWEACREALTKNGIAVVQCPGTNGDGSVTMTTVLMHSSGQWMRSEMVCKPMQPTAQGIGSVITYLRRYALSSMAGVAPDDDDDGNAASAPKEMELAQSRQQTQPPKEGNPFPPSEPPKPASNFWGRDNFNIDPAGKLDLAGFARTFERALNDAPNLKAVEKLVMDNGERLDGLEINHPDLHTRLSGLIADRQNARRAA